MLNARRCVLSIALVVGLAPAARATPVLMTPSAESQIEIWLGLDNLTFTNIFEKGPRDTPESWHASVDGMGPTVSLLEATDLSGATYVIGGYDPQSWDSSGGYHFTLADTDRTAFIFNLTTSVLRRQKLAADSFDVNCSRACGTFQTLNYPKYGPTFGGGSDLNVGFDLTQIAFDSRGETDTLDVGFEEAYTYGPGLVYYNDPGLLPRNLSGNFDTFTVGALETYTFTPVPEPPSLLLLITAVIGSNLKVAVKRRMRG